MKNFKKFLYRPFGKTIYDFSLINDRDRVLLCLSGGKDSTVMAELFNRWQKIVPINVHIEAIHIDFFKNTEITDFLIALCDRLNIKLTIINDDTVKEKIASSTNFSNCYVCARERRMRIFSYAKKNKINKVSFAHTRNDFSETLIMNMMYSGSISTLSINKDFFAGEFEVIRPLALIDEHIINEYICSKKLIVSSPNCPYSSNNKRELVREILRGLEENDKLVCQSLTASIKKWLLDKIQ